MFCSLFSRSNATTYFTSGLSPPADDEHAGVGGVGHIEQAFWAQRNVGWGVQPIAVASGDWELGELLSALGHRHQTVVLAIGNVKGAVRFGCYGDGTLNCPGPLPWVPSEVIA